MRTFVIGSKNLSVGILTALVDQGHQVLGVISRDLEPGMKVWHEKLDHKSLNEEATKLNIPVHEGLNVNSEESKHLLRELKLDIIFSCFWGQIIRQEVLDIPRLGIHNLHTAYLPLNRGSRPIPWSLIRGHEFTGLTIHQMHAGVDNGPIVSQVKVPIERSDNAFSLYEKVTNAGLELFRETLPQFANGTFKLIMQDETQATYQPRGEPFGAQINPDWDELMIDRFKRAFTFPPFRAYRFTPAILGKQPSAYFVIEPTLKTMTLSRSRNDYNIDSIGNKALRTEIRSQIPETENKGLRVNMNLDRMFPVHDILTKHSIEFTVSQVQSILDWGRKKAFKQPFRFENGLLEIPAIEVSDAKAIRDLIAYAKIQSKMEHRDIFVPVIYSDDTLIDDILTEISRCQAEQLTFTEVNQHFDTEYEHIRTSSI